MKKIPSRSRKPELVLPAGTVEKGRTAYLFGADACYGGLAKYSLRRAEVDTTPSDLRKLAAIAREQGKKFYATFNIFAHARHFKSLEKDVARVASGEPDAYIVSDPGVLSVIKRVAPRARIHLSTQANTLNSESVRFWKKQGVDRIVLARELTLREIKGLVAAEPKMEYEMFVHGAMCMAYSGRCIASSMLTGRSANLGDCTQTCRWEYKIKNAKAAGVATRPAGIDQITIDLEEKKRPEWEFRIEEYEDHSVWLSSKDLCLIEHVGKLTEAGVTAFKVEGRNKSAYYVAICARAYREGIDLVTGSAGEKGRIAAQFASNTSTHPRVTRKDIAERLGVLREQLLQVPHREYSSGMLFGHNEYLESGRRENVDYRYAGVVLRTAGDVAEIRVKEQLKLGEVVEFVTPSGEVPHKIKVLLDAKRRCAEIIRPGQADTRGWISIPWDTDVPPLSLIRKKSV